MYIKISILFKFAAQCRNNFIRDLKIPLLRRHAYYYERILKTKALCIGFVLVPLYFFLQNICQNRPDGIGSVSEVDERFVLGKTDGKLLFEDRIQKNIKY